MHLSHVFLLKLKYNEVINIEKINLPGDIVVNIHDNANILSLIFKDYYSHKLNASWD